MVSHSLAIQKFAPTLKVFAHPATSASAFISTSGLSISTGKLEVFVKGGEHLGGETFLQQTRRRPRLFLRIQCWRFVAMSYLFQTDHGLEWRISQKNPNGGLADDLHKRQNVWYRGPQSRYPNILDRSASRRLLGRHLGARQSGLLRTESVHGWAWDDQSRRLAITAISGLQQLAPVCRVPPAR